MSAQRLASRYAKSIMDLAREKGAVEEVYSDLQALKTNLSESRDLFLFLKSPIINPSKKSNVIDKLYKGKVNELTYSFYDIVVRKRREMYLPEIADAFVGLYNKEKGVVKAKVITAIPMSDALSEKIKGVVIKGTGAKTVELESTVDESIIGGFILSYEDKLYDSSVVHKLQTLQKEFAENKYVRKF